jgi:RimJ/RimL family protein N-acetyltransferase
MCDLSRLTPIPLPIETKRLRVRAFVPDLDAAAMVGVYGDPEVMRLIPGGALPSLDSVRAELEKHAQAQIRRGFSYWAVVVRTTGAVIGDVGFGIFEPTGDIELGYTLARTYWGHGYATEAASACLAAGRAHLSVPRIVAVADAQNGASMRVARRIGLRRIENVTVHGRQHVMFGTPSSGR